MGSNSVNHYGTVFSQFGDASVSYEVPVYSGESAPVIEGASTMTLGH